MEKLQTDFLGNSFYETINKIIDWLNGMTDTHRIRDVKVEGNNLVIIYINGDEETLPLHNTQYLLATVQRNGLMKASDVLFLDSLKTLVDKIEKIVTLNETIANGGNSSGGTGDDTGGGDGASNGDNGGMGGDGGESGEGEGNNGDNNGGNNSGETGGNGAGDPNSGTGGASDGDVGGGNQGE